MDKRITRRVVLGSVITGLAAGPFVVRRLRHQGNGELTQQGYNPFRSEARNLFFNDWKDDCKTLSAKQTPIANPAALTLKYDFTKPRVLNFRSLETTFMGDFDSPETSRPENLMYYSLMEGTIKVEGGASGKLQVSVLKNVQKHAEIDFEASRKNGAKIVESQTRVSDGSVVRNVTITPSLSFDAATKSKKADVVEKIVVDQLPVCQFLFTSSLNPDPDSIGNIRKLPNNLELLKLVLNFSNLIRFPIPEHSVEIGQEYSYPMTREDAFILEVPSYKARLQGMVRCSGFNAVSVVPICVSIFAEYREYLRKHYDTLLSERVRAGRWTEQKIREEKQWYDERIDEVGKKTKEGIPNLSYLIDSEMGCVLRREEYNTNNVGKVSAVQKIFQLV